MSAIKGTKREAIVEAINAYYSDHGYPPTVREVGTMCGLESSSTIHYWLNKLRDEGIIEWHTGSNRTLRVLEGAQ